MMKTALVDARKGKVWGALSAVEYAVYGAVLAACALLFAHPDLAETANHARVMLDCIFDGRFLDFYRVVMEHNNTLYYINNANYNAAFYMLFALWELPVYLFGKIFSVAVSECFMWYWAKLLPIGCMLYSARLVGELVGSVTDERDGKLARAATLLNPIIFFYPAVMGQYDSICVMFILLALVYYIRGDMTRFSAIMGVAILCKSFALLAVLPLILLADKKLIYIARDLALAAAPALIVSLIFRDTGDSVIFKNIMIGRLFERVIWDRVPVFPAVIAVMSACCFLTKLPTEKKERLRSTAYITMAVFACLILTVESHPQWIYLFAPFFVIVAHLNGNRTVCFYLSAAASCGAFLYGWLNAPLHLEANLLYFGVSGINLNLPSVLTYIKTTPLRYGVSDAFLFASLTAMLAVYAPLGGRSLADKASDSGAVPVYKRERFCLWISFAVGFGFWIAGVVAVFYKAGLIF